MHLLNLFSSIPNRLDHWIFSIVFNDEVIPNTIDKSAFQDIKLPVYPLDNKVILSDESFQLLKEGNSSLLGTGTGKNNLLDYDLRYSPAAYCVLGKNYAQIVRFWGQEGIESAPPPDLYSETKFIHYFIEEYEKQIIFWLLEEESWNWDYPNYPSEYGEGADSLKLFLEKSIV